MIINSPEPWMCEPDIGETYMMFYWGNKPVMI